MPIVERPICLDYIKLTMFEKVMHPCMNNTFILLTSLFSLAKRQRVK